MTKRLLTAVLALVMLVSCVFPLASCKKHSHDYKANVTATCTAAGETVYSCSCGASYSEYCGPLGHAMVQKQGNPASCNAGGYEPYEECSRCGYTTIEHESATGHYFAITSIEYPTLKESGSKTMTCKACGLTTTEKIDALSLSLPSVSDILVSLIGDKSATIALEDTLIIISEENDRYDLQNGSKRYIALNVAEVHLESVDGVAKGHFKLEIGSAEFTLDGTVDPDTLVPTSFKSQGHIYLYVNGDVISFEFDDNQSVKNQEFTSDEFIMQLLMLFFGGDDEAAIGGILYLGGYIVDALPAVVDLASAISDALSFSDDYVAGRNQLMATIGQEFINTSTKANGDVTYSSDVTAFKAFLDSARGKTVAQYIDHLYGAGTADGIKNFLRNMTSMTVKELTNSAIHFAEAYDVDIDAIFTLIDLYVYAATQQSFNVKYELQHNINMTIGDILTQGTEESQKAETIKNINDGIKSIIDEFIDQDIAALYNQMTYGDPNYMVDGKVFNVFEAFDAMLDQLQAEAHFGFTFDAEGNFVAGIVEISGYLLSINKTNDGFKAVITYSEDNSGYIELNVTENLITLVGYANNEKILDGYFKTTEVEPGVVNGEADLKVGDFDCIDLSFTQKDGVYTDLHFVFMIEQSKYETVYNEATGTYEEVFVSTYSYEAIKIDLTTGDGYESFALVIDDLSFTSHCEYTDAAGYTYGYETGSLKINEDELLAYEAFTNNDVLESFDITLSIPVNDNVIGEYLPGVDEVFPEESVVPFTLTAEEEEEEPQKYAKIKLSWSNDEEGNGHVRLTVINASEDTISVELKKQGNEYHFIFNANDEVNVDMVLGVEELEDGVKLSFDTGKLLASTRKEMHTIGFDEYNVPIVEYYNSYTYNQFIGTLSITIK